MAGYSKIYTSQTDYLYDLAKSQKYFSEEQYAKQTQQATGDDYLAFVATYEKNLPQSFDQGEFDKLNDDDKFAYMLWKADKNTTSEAYKQNEAYFNQKFEQIKNEEIYNSLSGFEKAINTFGGWVGSLLVGAYGTIEGLLDLGGLAVGAKDFVAKDITGYTALQNELNDWRQAYTFENKQQWLGVMNDVFGAIGQMAPMLITGGASGVVKGMGTATYYLAMAGSTAESAVRANPNINYGSLLGYTALMTGLEAGTEWLSGKVFGEGLIGVKGLNTKAITGGMFGTLLHNMGTEAVEEAVSEIFGGLFEYWIVTQDRQSLPTVDKVLYAALIGGLTGGFMTGGRILLTPRMSVTQSGELKYTKELTAAEERTSKKLGLHKSWALQSLLQQSAEALSSIDAMTKLQAKYGELSLEQIRTQHAEEYNNALAVDVETKERQAKSFLALAKLMNTIGVENFKESVDLLNMAAEDAKRMADNYINRRSEGNKKAVEVFNAYFPDRSFTPSAIPSNQNQALSEALRKAFPNLKIVFGKFGDKNGDPVRAINGAETYLFLDEDFVNQKGYKQALTEAIRYQLADQLMLELSALDANEANTLVKLFTDTDVPYSELTREQKLSIAQILCFDPVNSRKLFNHSNKTHRKIFKYITDQAEYVKKFGRQTEANKIRYHDLLAIRNSYLRDIALTIGNMNDVETVAKEYGLSDEEVKTQIIDKMQTTDANDTIKLTEINQVKSAIQQREAYNELYNARANVEEPFDFNRLYDKDYYSTEFVNDIAQNEPNFERALQTYLRQKYNVFFDDKASFTVAMEQTLGMNDVNMLAEILLTAEYLNTKPSWTDKRKQVIDKLYLLKHTGADKSKLEGDSIIVTDDQIKGTGKLKFFKGDVYERFDILGTKQDRANSESARKELQRNPRENRTYNTEYVSYLTVAVQDENTLEKYQKDIVRATKKAYGMNVKFFKNSPLDRSTNYTMDDVKGFISKSKNTIYIKDDISVDDNVIVTVVRHEITHHLLDVLKTKNNADYVQLIADVKKTVGTNTWNKIRENIKNTYKRESSTTLDEETLVSILNDECSLPDEIDSDTLTAAQEKLFKNSEYNDPFVRPSVVKDSSIDDLNRKLTEQQQKYFKDSVVRDILGRLITMYHGTPNGGFTIFDIDQVLYGLFGKGFYHTENPDVGRKYSENRRGNKRQVYEVYMNITNPIDMDAEGNLSEWIKAVPDAEDYFPKTGTNEEFFRALEDYMQDEEMTRDDAGDFVIATLSEMGYDGITHVGGKRVNQNDPYHRVYIAFYPEQIKSVYNTHPTQDVDIMFSRDLSQQTSNETKNIKSAAKAQTGKEIANAIVDIVKTMPMKLSEAQGFEKPYMYRSLENIRGTLDDNTSLFNKINEKNWHDLYGTLYNSTDPDTRQALILLKAYLRIDDQNNINSVGYMPLDDKSRFSEDTRNEILSLLQAEASLNGQQLSAISKTLSDKTSFSELKQRFEKDGYSVSVSDEMVQRYVPETKDKKSFEKEIDKQINDISDKIENGDDLDKAELNQELRKLLDKKYVVLNESNEKIIDWALSNEDVPTVASKIQQDVFKQFVATAELAEKTEGKKALTILVDDKTGLPKPFPKATQWIEKNVKRLKSFRMWAMLTSPVSWVRNWVGNAGMTALDSATNQLEKWMTARLPQIDVAKLEQQAKELNSKKTLTDAEKTKLAEINAQIQQAYDFKFVETTASKELKQQIAQEYKSVFQQILNGEDISKYEGSAEKAGAIARAEREITRKSENANFVQKVWAACQSMTDWGLNTGLFGDNAVVLNSLIKNFANMVESNKTYLIKSLTTEYGKDGRGMSAERKALVEKALNTKNSMDIVNAMSKSDVELFMDSCKQRTFEQYFKNSNWLSKWASNLSQKHPILASLTSLVLPFPKVAANIMTMAYKYSPLGFISALRQWSVVKQMDAAGYKGVRDAFARAKLTRTTAQATVGTVMCIAGLILASLGFVDIDDDDYLGPALHIGDLRISLSNLAPSMTTFSVGAAMMWAWKNDQSAALKALDVLYDNTLLGNIENVFRYGDPTKYIENLSINYVSQYVPAMLKLFAKITTNQAMIDKSGSYFEKLGKTFVSGIPFAADLLSKKINPYTGEFLTNTGSQNVFFNIMEAISPLDFKTTTKSKTQKEAERLGTESSGLTGKFKINDKEYDIDKVTYSKYRATYIQNTFDNIMNGKQKVTVEDENGKRITTTYDKLTDKQKKNVLSRLYTEATNITKIKWWTDQGNKYVVTDRDLYNEYRKQFKNIIYKKTWTKSKFVES